MKDFALDVFLLDRALDHEIAIGKSLHGIGERDPRHRLLAGILGDEFLGDLARQVAIDGRHARLQAVGGDIVEHHVETGQCRDVSDAIAHLARTDHADFFYHDRHLVILLVRTRDTGVTLYFPSLPSASVNSGTA